MANRLLRNIAVSIGAGLAAGFGRTIASRQPRRPTPKLHPLLSRLEDIEGRVSRVELAPSVTAPAPEEIAALGTLVLSQSEDIASLRQQLERIERRNAEQSEAFGQKVALVEQQVPAHIDASVSAHMEELEQRLRGEFQQIQQRTVDAFTDRIEQRVIGRIAQLENSLDEHSQSITALREKSLKTDDHLNRLLEAVEKLCVRVEAKAQMPVPPPTAAPAPVQESFATHYQRALAQATETPSVNGHAPPAPAPRRDVKPVGMAILGLAILGFRLMR